MRNISSVKQFAEVFGTAHTEPLHVSGLCGRLIRGKQPQDFEMLSNDPTRKVVFIMGSDGLQEIVNQTTGYDMLKTIGYAEQHIVNKVKEGNQFKLAVFPEGGPARPATWQTMFALLSEAYGIDYDFSPHITDLHAKRFDEISEGAPFDYHQVTSEGVSSPYYMTPERFAASPHDLRAVRDLAYFTGSMRQQFGGNGKVVDDAGHETMDEYAMLNVPLASLGECALLDIEVRLPG